MDNLTDMQREYLEALRLEEKEELENNAEIISSFKRFMSKKKVVLTDGNFKYIPTTGIVATFPNMVNLLYPNEIDKENIFSFKKLCEDFEKKIFNTGYLFAENYMLMASPYFRRGFNEVNNYAPRFVELFWNFCESDIETYISLDMNRVRINVDNSAYMERDIWFGAKFNEDIAQIPNGTVKLRPPMEINESLNSLFFQNTYSLDIKWITKENIKTFQSEEFKTDKIKIKRNNTIFYPVRYIHAEYDLDKGYFRHFDGAIHFYTETEYFNRRDSDFNYNNKNTNQIKTDSQKLFKMNGKIDICKWIDFSSHFYHGNPLVFEYFEGKYPQQIEEMLEKVRKNSINE
ncbi:hypothetical protein LJC16_00875 [Bacteroidales bacterium OttesenSCG-928-C19]|nr:hypothetical protein [Bacteroidales bacterium OttesenSCG-928-C19]